MAFQARLAAGAAVSALLAHGVYVHRLRERIPTGRGLRFAPGGADDVLASTLRTGDVVLFSRDAVLYGFAGALACEARQRWGGSGFDHAGVIVVRAGEPHLLEATQSGIKLRRYDARVRCSRSREIAVRPLGRVANEDALDAAALRAFLVAEGVYEGDAPFPTVAPAALERGSQLDIRSALRALTEAVRIVTGIEPSANASAALVGRVYEHALRIPRARVVGGSTSTPPLTMRDLEGQPWGGGARLKAPRWVRDT